jgi:hypothetical protein
MLCYQVTAQFVFHQHRPVLVSTHIKKQNAKAFLVFPACLSVMVSNTAVFFHTKKEASGYVSRLHTVYKNRIISSPALPGGQLLLFQEVSNAYS